MLGSSAPPGAPGLSLAPPLGVLALALLVGCDAAPPSTASSIGAPPQPSAATSSPATPSSPSLASSAAPPAAPAAPPAAAASADVTAGAGLYAKYCALCHGADAKGYAADNAPSLISDTFLRSATDAFIAAGISIGRPGTPMAAYSRRLGGPLADEQVGQIVAFLRSKGPAAETLTAVAAGNAEQGRPLFAAMCASCHADSPQRTAPRLDIPALLHSATDSFLDYAIRNGRPGTKMEPYAGRLEQGQINDLIAYLRTFQNPAAPAAMPAPTGKEAIVINPKGKHPTFTLRDGRFVPAADVAAALAAKKRMVILDARATSDWMLGHIPGAIPMPYYDMKRADEIPKDGTWVLAYCACPHHASGEVIDALRKLGYPNTAVIDEGILFWQKQGYPMKLPAPADGAKPAPGSKVLPAAPAKAKPAKPAAAPPAPAPAAK